MKVGFVGLGKLGSAMVTRLNEKGFTPIVYNRTVEKAKNSGFEYVNTPKELTEKDVEFIIINVFDTFAVNDIFNSPAGLMTGDLKNKTIIDTTTHHYRYVSNFSRLSKNAGGKYLEAPVIGSVIPAKKGELMIVVSGEKETFEKSKPILETLGKKIVYFPEAAKATKFKLINNMVMGGFLAVLSEALSIAEKAGFTAQETLDLLSDGAGESKILNLKKEKLINNDFSPHFDIKTLVKDLHYLSSLSYDLNQPSALSSLVKELYTMAGSNGNFEDDFAAIFKFMKNS